MLATGATGHNAIYNTDTATWSAAPDFPKNSQGHQLAIADGPVALLPNGNVLCLTAPGVYGQGIEFFEWDGSNFTPTVATPNADREFSYLGRMLVLPTGQIMLTDGTTDVELYTSPGVPNPSWAPVITTYSATLTHGKDFDNQRTTIQRTLARRRLRRRRANGDQLSARPHHEHCYWPHLLRSHLQSQFHGRRHRLDRSDNHLSSPAKNRTRRKPTGSCSERHSFHSSKHYDQINDE